MTQEDRRRELELEIAELSRAWRATTDADAKAGIKAQMDQLRAAVNSINVTAGRELATKIDGILQKLEEVRTRHALDAVSALGRSIERLRKYRDKL